MVLFVGDQPSDSKKPGAQPFEGSKSKAKLLSWIKIINSQPYYIVNIQTKNDKLMINLWGYTGSPIVALGSKASRLLGRIPHYRLPHPSGRNRKLNNKKFIAKELEKCKTYIKLQQLYGKKPKESI